MSYRTHARRFARACALAIAVLLAGLAPTTFAASGPTLTVIGAGSAQCRATGRLAAALQQGKPFNIELAGFNGLEDFELWLTFPDGRVYSPDIASVVDDTGVNGLDGVFDFPADVALPRSTVDDGTHYEQLLSTDKWPLGCYSITARSATGTNRASARFVVQPPSMPGAAGPTKLSALEAVSKQGAGLQGSSVSISGSGFVPTSEVTISVIQPNGTILPVAVLIASLKGGFQTNYLLETYHRVGLYTFVAIGPSSVPGAYYRTTASFNLRALAVRASGPATLSVADPFSAIVKQQPLQPVVLKGKRYPVAVQLVLGLVTPEGAILLLPGPPTPDPIGDLNYLFTPGWQLPTGIHKVIIDEVPGDTNILALTSLKLLPGDV